ncbi:DUF6082 family protein [Dactylosporangium sp. NPDC049742]|uniref:DUF6082 family protein n=1 Tax=Dactylosporangium sp. NPDC049742 TaxID=3154737 RepID=UPI00342CFD48
MTVEGLSALIASLALLGVVISLFLQARQLRIMRLQSVRSMQFELERIVLADPDVYPSHLTDGNSDVLRRRMFMQMWLKYVELGYHVGEFDDASVRANARKIFGDSTYLEHWRRAQEAEPSRQSTNKASRFRVLLTEEAERSRLMPPPG